MVDLILVVGTGRCWEKTCPLDERGVNNGMDVRDMFIIL